MIHVLIENVHRQRQKHRPARRRARKTEGAAERRADIVTAAQLLRPFRHRRSERDQVARKPRLGHEMPRVLLAGGDHQRGLARLGGDQHAHGVAEAAHRVQVDEGGAACGERPTVGHADRRRLLKAEHVANVRRIDERVHERHLGRAGIAEDVGYAFIAQDVDENVTRASGHRMPSLLGSHVLQIEPRHCEP